MKTRKSVTVMILTLLCVMLMSMTASAKSDTVATIGSKKYTSLTSALKNVKKGQTIVLKKNVTFTKPLTISRNVTFTLNLNKKAITFKNKGTTNNNLGLRVSRGNVTIKNGTLKETNSRSLLLLIDQKASVTIKSGTYTGVISNSGKLTVDKGTFRTTSAMEKDEEYNSYLLINQGTGTMTINGGSFTTRCRYLLGNGGPAKLTINGGTFTHSQTFNSDLEACEINNGGLIRTFGKSGTIKVNGGKFTSAVPVFLILCGKITVTKGTFTSKEGATMALTEKASATVTGGTWSISSCRPNFLLLDDSSVTVKGGTFKSECTSVEANGHSHCKITGGKFSTTLQDPESTAMLWLAENGRITVTGGTFTGKKTCGYIKSGDSSIKIKGGKFNVVNLKAPGSN